MGEEKRLLTWVCCSLFAKPQNVGRFFYETYTINTTPTMVKHVIAILTVTLISCSNSDNSSNTAIDSTKGTEKKDISPKNDTFAIRELSFNKDNDQGWGADIRLSFTESTPTDTGIVYKVKSIYKDKIIGFELTVPNPGFSKLVIKSV